MAFLLMLRRPISMTVNIGIYLFDQVEMLDFAGPFEVFRLAR
jgi:hypothetical protein